MPVAIHNENFEAGDRLTAIRLTVHTLRLMENWRRKVSDYDCVMILLAVLAITAERLTRGELEPRLMRIAEPFPSEQLAPCNISSIAAATGINRETVRRKVKGLIEKGFLVRSDAGVVSFKSGHFQQEYIQAMVRDQLETVARLTNDLCRDGILICTLSERQKSLVESSG